MTFERAWDDWKPVETNLDILPAPDGDAPQPAEVQLTPYVHWSVLGPGEDDIGFDPQSRDHDLVLMAGGSRAAVSQSSKPWFAHFEGLLDSVPVPAHAASPSSGSDADAPRTTTEHRLPAAELLPTLGNDTVIAGVIDVGIPLGHRRTRLADGRTRILAAWNMLAEFAGTGEETGVPFGREIFESQLNAALSRCSGGRLDGPLDEMRFNTETGTLTMNLNGGTSDLARRASHGAHVLDLAAGADPEASWYKESPVADKSFRDKVRIIAVNAPSAATFGSGGTYLDQFLFHAIKRVVDLADAIWDKNNPQPIAGGRKGYEIVLNMAFGRQAGSKDTFDRFARAMATFQRARKASDRAPVHFVMPVGNDNLTQSNAFLEPLPQELQTLDWRVLPGDQSSNFVEIWCDDLEDEAAGTAIAPGLCAPGGNPDLPMPPDAGNKTFYTFLRQSGDVIAGAYAHRYRVDGNGQPVTEQAAQQAAARAGPEAESARQAMDDARAALQTVEDRLQGKSTLTEQEEHELLQARATWAEKRDAYDTAAAKLPRHKLRVVFAVPPTYRPAPPPRAGSSAIGKTAGPAGVWQLEVTNRASERLTCVLSVQTDQGLTPGRTINLRSYFEHPKYQRHDPLGRPMESYSYPLDRHSRVINQDILTDTPIRRHGTMLAYAANAAVVRVGGFCASDKRPAIYSSTGRGRIDGSDDGTLAPSKDDPARRTRRTPNAAFPTEDSPALFGIFAAGSAEGSTVAQRGTSFATSQASRLLLDLLVEVGLPDDPTGEDAGDGAASAALHAAGRAAEGEGGTGVDALMEVIGRGRIPAPVKWKIQRR